MTARNSYLLRKYGITEHEYDTLFHITKGCCWVCGRHSSTFKVRLSVDHDHKTGEIRGLLCGNCNRFVIGRHRAGMGGAVLLRNAGQYLDGPYTGFFVPVKKKKRKSRKRKVRK